MAQSFVPGSAKPSRKGYMSPFGRWCSLPASSPFWGKAKQIAFALSLSCGLTSWTPRTEARVQQETGYTKQQAFNGALRFIRVDSGYQVTERDLDSGYFLFEYPSSDTDTPNRGSVEVVEQESGVLVIVQLPQLPEHHERYLADKLLAKLRSDYGEPPQRKEPAPARKPKNKEKEDEPRDKQDQEEGSEKSKDSTPREERVPGHRIK